MATVSPFLTGSPDAGTTTSRTSTPEARWTLSYSTGRGRNQAHAVSSSGTARARSRAIVEGFKGLLGQHRSDAGHVHDIVRFAAARKVHEGTRQALHQRTERGRAGKTLAQLVGNVARVEVREDEHVRAAG